MTALHKAFANVSWMAGGQVLTTAAGFAVSITLARLLAPHDFGVMALALGLQAIAVGLTDFGLAALVIRADLTSAELRALFRLRLALGVAQAAALGFGSAWLAAAVAEPQVTTVLQWLALGVLVAGAGALPEALLRKQLRFRALVAVGIVATVASGALGIGMAVAGYGLWSLVGQQLCSVVLAAVLHTLLAGWHVRGPASYASLAAHGSYVAHTYGLNVVGALVWQADRIILGRLLGATALGFYMRGLGLAQQLQSVISSAAEQVGFPTLAALQKIAAEVRSAFLDLVTLLASVLGPAMLVLAALSEPVVLFLFGERWQAAHPLLRLLAIGLMLNALNLTWDWLLRAIGRADVLFRWALVDGTARLVLLAAGAWLDGAQGAAAGYLAASVPSLLLRAVWLAPVAGLTAAAFLRRLLLPLGVGLGCAAVATVAASQFMAHWAQLAAGLAGAAVVYITAARVFGNPLLELLRRRQR